MITDKGDKPTGSSVLPTLKRKVGYSLSLNDNRETTYDGEKRNDLDKREKMVIDEPRLGEGLMHNEFWTSLNKRCSRQVLER